MRKIRILGILVVVMVGIMAFVGNAAADVVPVSDLSGLNSAISGAPAGEKRTIKLIGTITVDSQIESISGKNLEIRGDENTEIVVTGSVSGNLISVEGNSDLTIRGVKIVNQGGVSAGVSVGGGSLILDGVTIDGSGSTGEFKGVVAGSGASSVSIVGESVITDCTCGIEASTPVFELRDSTVQNSKGKSGICLSENVDAVITNSEIKDNQGRKGAGIYANHTGTLKISHSTLSGNKAVLSGGGLYVEKAEVTIEDLTVTKNSAETNGGGIYNQSGNLTIERSTFTENSCVSGGGGLCHIDGSLEVSGSDFSKNTARLGGGLHNYRGTVNLSGTGFSKNSAAENGGGVSNYAGTLTMSGSDISDNAADAYGGGFYTYTGTSTVSESKISGNVSGQYGGGVFSYGTLNMSDSKILNNTSRHFGGGLYIGKGQSAVTGCDISGNTATQKATENVEEGGTPSDAATGFGGGVANGNDSHVLVDGCKVTNNKAAYGGGVLASTGGLLELLNSEVSGNSADKYGGGVYRAGGLVVRDSVIRENRAEYGGGVYSRGFATDAESRNAGEMHLISGEICNNHADIHGGGIYVPESVGYQDLKNAVIYGNYAANQGGGIWICPTGDSSFYVTDGIATFANTAKQAGDDLVIQQPRATPSYAYRVVLSRRMLGGRLNHYYDDGGMGDGPADNIRKPRGTSASVPRYSAGTSVERLDIYDVRNPVHESLVLKNVVSGEAQDRAKNVALLLVHDNDAGSCGGGVASNGRVMFGQATELPIEVTAVKEWEDGNENHKEDSVTINLHQLEADKLHHNINDYILETVELNAKNEWKYVFENLPEGYHDADNNWIPYIYQITEEEGNGFVPTYSEAPVEIHVRRDENNIFTPDLESVTVSLQAFIEKSDGTTLDITEDMRNLPELAEYMSIFVRDDSTERYVYVLDQSNGFRADWGGFPWKIPQDIIDKYELIREEYPIDYVLEVVDARNSDGTKNPYATISGEMRITVTVTNHYDTFFNLTVRKVWDDENNQAGSRPESVTVHLRANGNVIETTEINGTYSWTHVFVDLPWKNENGELISYTVTEEPVTGYEISGITREGHDGYLIVNRPARKQNGFIPELREPAEFGYDHRFTFTKVWRGEAGESIHWTLYNSDGTPVRKMFNKRVLSDNEWVYEAWFETWDDYYLVEEVPAGYAVTYENVGPYSGITDRCCSGGTIINYKVPRTGDTQTPVLWIVMASLSMAGIALIMRRRRMHSPR